MAKPPPKRGLLGISPYEMKDLLKSIAEVQKPLKGGEGLRQTSLFGGPPTMKPSSSGQWKRSQEGSEDNIARKKSNNTSSFTNIEDAKREALESVDVQTINSVKDLEVLVRAHPGSMEEKIEYVFQLRKKMREVWRRKYCVDYNNNPNMKFIPAAACDIGSDPPVFLPPCSCDWTCRGEILHGVTPLPIMWFDLSRYIDLDGIYESNPFYPRKHSGTFYNYWGGFSLAFVRNFMRLPKELRHAIYELVAFSWVPDKQYPLVETQTPRLKFARRNIQPIFGPVSEIEVHDQYSQLSHHMKYKAGMLDYFKEEEYRNLEAFCDALVIFEGRMYQTKSTRVPLPIYFGGKSVCSKPGKSIVGEHLDLRREEQRSLGILNDFVAWFWENVVVDMSSEVSGAFYRDQDPTNKGKEIIIPAKIRRRDYKPRELQHTSPCEQASHHRWISHLTFSTQASHSRRGANTIQQEFRGIMDVCDYIKLNLPCLRTLRVFLRISPRQARQVISSQGNLPWIQSIRSLPTLEQFNYHVLVENPPSWKNSMESISTEILLELTKDVTKVLELCMPRVSV
ncbi:hypothetical protein HYFRA_00007164 [Hymenoscyphus fraxineus]|uniref:Uncharacterized protein n=1 Tax=Hymenoscyphus fraxineus TaxID=746836 RepID=A0A9N9KX81_9HELO|nr:hypothetical protein HYFRA_00007164 [Hymenoscyphus fraxineus]